MRHLAVALCALALQGCIQVPDTMSDEEIRSKGLWTERDDEARVLLDRYVGPGRPVRYAPYSRKFATPKNAIETLTGMSYDKQYYYVRERGVYVFPGRGTRAPFVIAEDPDEQRPQHDGHVRP